MAVLKPRFWSWFITSRFQRLGVERIDTILKDVQAEQELCRRQVRRWLIEFKNWNPTEVQHGADHKARQHAQQA